MICRIKRKNKVITGNVNNLSNSRTVNYSSLEYMHTPVHYIALEIGHEL